MGRSSENCGVRGSVGPAGCQGERTRSFRTNPQFKFILSHILASFRAAAVPYLLLRHECLFFRAFSPWDETENALKMPLEVGGDAFVVALIDDGLVGGVTSGGGVCGGGRS